MSRRFTEGLAVALLAGCLSCAGYSPGPRAPSASRSAEVTRFRLLLSANHVNPGEAFRCHGACQDEETPEAYLQCLAQCPGFEQTPGVACAPNEVPPLAACFAARPAPTGSEPQPGSVVVAVIAGVPILAGLSAVCASQSEPCSYVGAGLVP